MNISFELNNPDLIYSVDEAKTPLEKSGSGFHNRDVSVFLNPKDKNSMQVSVASDRKPIKYIILIWRVSVSENCLLMGDHWERGYGDFEWRGVVPERVMPWYFMVYNPQSGLTDGIGIKTGASSLCSWQLDQDCLTLRIDIRNGALGTILNKRVLNAAHIVIREGIPGEDIFTAGEAFCRKMCEKPVLPTSPVYGGNNWYYAYGHSNFGKIISDAAFISSLSDSDNRPYMVIDDGWQLCRNDDYTGGPWHTCNKDYANMEKLAEKIKNEGAKPGIWIRPLLNCENFSMPWRLPAERFLSRSYGGEYGCFMDPSIPEMLNRIKTDVERLASWGYELIKHDYTTYDIFGRWGGEMGSAITNDNWCFHDRSKTSMEIVLKLYRTIKSAAGANSIVLGCNTIGHAGAGIFELQRTGDDTSGNDWERTRKMGINTLAFRGIQHNTFFAADADCVGITDKIPWELNDQWLSLVSKSGTPLFVSIDPLYANPEHRAKIKAAFDCASKEQPTGRPLDFLQTTCPTLWELNGERYRFHWNVY